MTRRSFLVMMAVLLSGCASRQIAGGALNSVSRPAFISRFANGAGPHSLVFREDSSYKDKLKTLSPEEADRRLQVKLANAVTRFEISERLRESTVRQLPAVRPWTNTVDPSQVASTFELWLTHEDPEPPPDYKLLKDLRADSVVEFVIQDFGMRSEKGRAGPFIKGFARMFRLGGGDLWYRTFSVDRVAEGAEHLDPFKVGKDPSIYRNQLAEMLEPLAEQFAQDLNPKDRDLKALPPEQTAPDSVNPTVRPPPVPPPAPKAPVLAPGELPDPDA